MKLHDARILVVDDNEELCALVLQICRQDGFFHVSPVFSCREAERRLEEGNVDFMILDVNLPDEDGFSFFMRKAPELERKGIPVLFLSARDQDEDRLRGLGLGADDYMVKPFLAQELILRIRAILRRAFRPSEEREEQIRLGKRIVDLPAGVIRLPEGGQLPLTNKEYKLLKLFLENPGRILTFDYLSEMVWGMNYYDYENTLMVHIRKLREKIEEQPSRPEHLITVKGLGYRLDL